MSQALCECFASEIFCKDCNCLECSNNEISEAARNEAIQATRARNPIASKQKMGNVGEGVDSAVGGTVADVNKTLASDSTDKSTGYNIGCGCKKSKCQRSLRVF